MEAPSWISVILFQQLLSQSLRVVQCSLSVERITNLHSHRSKRYASPGLTCCKGNCITAGCCEYVGRQNPEVVLCKRLEAFECYRKWLISQQSVESTRDCFCFRGKAVETDSISYNIRLPAIRNARDYPCYVSRCTVDIDSTQIYRHLGRGWWMVWIVIINCHTVIKQELPSMQMLSKSLQHDPSATQSGLQKHVPGLPAQYPVVQQVV